MPGDTKDKAVSIHFPSDDPVQYEQDKALSQVSQTQTQTQTQSDNECDTVNVKATTTPISNDSKPDSAHFTPSDLISTSTSTSTSTSSPIAETKAIGTETVAAAKKSVGFDLESNQEHVFESAAKVLQEHSASTFITQLANVKPGDAPLTVPDGFEEAVIPSAVPMSTNGFSGPSKSHSSVIRSHRAGSVAPLSVESQLEELERDSDDEDDDELVNGNAELQNIDTAPVVEDTAPLTFTYIAPKFKSLQSSETRQLLTKWNVDTSSQLATFSYNRKFDEAFADSFFRDLLNSEAFQTNFGAATSATTFSTLGQVSNVELKQLPTTMTTLAIFDRLKENGLVAASGSIKKCLESVSEDFDNVPIADEVRKAVLDWDSDHYDDFSDEERDELLFRLFQHMLIGGPLCQYEDELNDVLATVKNLYRDLVCVWKDSSTGQVQVGSKVYSICSVEDGTVPLFPHDSMHNCCYACIDPVQRKVHVYYFAFVPYW
jgi:cilia- and flagella-associated protein 300